MTRPFLMVSALVLLAACNAPPAAQTSTDERASPALPPAPPPAPPANDAKATDFAPAAAVNDLFEIASGKIALRRAAKTDVKAFARMMIEAHGRSTTALKAAIGQSGSTITLPLALPGDKQAVLDRLEDAPAADFDRNFMDAQIDGHQSILGLMAHYANAGDTPAIKAFAEKTGPEVQKHLARAKAIRMALSA